jgi:hypothetical protein
MAGSWCHSSAGDMPAGKGTFKCPVLSPWQGPLGSPNVWLLRRPGGSGNRLDALLGGVHDLSSIAWNIRTIY